MASVLSQVIVQQQQKRPSGGDDAVRCKRRINFASSGVVGGAAPYHQQHVQPASVARRNARERNRVKQVNNGFATLRQHIPVSVAAALSSPTPAGGGGRQASKKLSKVETLRLAVEYIRSLKAMLDEHDGVVTPGGDGGSASSGSYYVGDDAGSGGNFTLSPPASSGSPTPSYASEGSYGGAAPPSVYDNYEPMSPEDEELLDVISWWQQSQ